jgi:hypothetical protein
MVAGVLEQVVATGEEVTITATVDNVAAPTTSVTVSVTV